MSTIVYQELQPSWKNESYLVESTTLSLKLNSSKKTSLKNCSSKSEYESTNLSGCGGWSSIEALPSKKDKEDGPVYVHPLVKRSSFMLSEKSLKMCTESLGCETGTCDIASADTLFTSSSSSSSLMTTTMKMTERKPREKFDIRKELSLNHGKFPPPLTSISGSSPIRVRPYREGGRLVIEAVSCPPTRPYMKAERSDGRLKLSMLMDASADHIVEDDDQDGSSVDGNGGEDLVECQDEQEEEVNKNDAYLLEEMNGVKVEFGVKLGMGKIQRPSRCKESGQGNKRLINWETFCVAT